LSGRHRWKEKPVVWVAAGLATIVAVVLFTPSSDVLGTVARLSSYSAAPGGARGLYELARHLGWDVARSTSGRLPGEQTTPVYAVLDPAIPLTGGELGDLLARVRGGAGLLIVAERETPLADSLGVRVGSRFGALPWDTTNVCPERRRFALRAPLWDVPTIQLSRRDSVKVVSFLALQVAWIGSAELPAVVGFELGRGRVGVVSDPLLLANDVIKECRFPAGLAVAGLLQYLRGPGDGASRSLLVFDEFHHGYGPHPSIRNVAGRMLFGTAPGRGLAQVALAGVILLAAVAPRALPPRSESKRERRSPLEHVEALATAYHAVGATRTAARRLVRGLRRRLSQGRIVATSESDEAFLRELAATHPEVEVEVDRVLQSLANRSTARELVETRDSIRRIERLLGREHD
jgi:hypothetical protein